MERKFGTGMNLPVYPELSLISRVCSGDCAHCPHNISVHPDFHPGADFTPAEMEEIQQSMEKGIEKYKHLTGPRKCLSCQFKWVPEPGHWKSVNPGGTVGQYLQCPQCGSFNVVGDSAEPPRIEVVFPSSNRTPEEELERTERLLHPRPEQPPLTVGDLSCATAARNSPRAQRQQFRAMRNGDSIGDLSVVTAAHDSIENELQRNRAEKDGLSVGDLFVGRRVSHFQPVAESQKLLEKKYEADDKAADMRFLVENPSELEKRAAELLPKLKAAVAESEKRQEELRKEEAWRDVENRLRAKGISFRK